MKKTTFAASAAVALTAATALYAAYPAFAQSDHAQSDHAQSGRDPMGGATVTWADAKTKADTMWTKLDVNKDGVLNHADREAKMGEMFGAIDTNRDGSISKAEFMDHHKAMMDGGGQHGKGRDGAEGRPPMGAGMMGRGAHRMHDMADKADTNHDGTITHAEFDATAKARFDTADTDHDGKLTATERRAAWKAMRGERGGHGMGGHRMGGHAMDGDMGDTPPPPPAG
jgi:hypothetical protein